MKLRYSTVILTINIGKSVARSTHLDLLYLYKHSPNLKNINTQNDSVYIFYFNFLLRLNFNNCIFLPRLTNLRSMTFFPDPDLIFFMIYHCDFFNVLDDK